ncbi:hypothetical protein F5Y04DRAFT_261714 [Hypomontagnella monticulosa]|nr:hypothetical protein F5Y04DRAFT_261714 [Hypomontagnella monticulosa]
MDNIALREMVRALRSKSPDVGLKKLTAEIQAILPESMKPEKKTIKEIRQYLDNEEQPTTPTKARGNEFNRRIQAAFEMFRDAERDYLLGLGRTTVRSALRNPRAQSWSAASYLRHYFEILLTLKNMKPCTLICMGTGPQGSIMMNGMVLQCLAPMMQRFELESYGFTLRYLAHDVLTEQLGHSGFKGSWIFADKQSEAWSKVEDIFLLPHPGRRTPEDTIGSALGYPLPGGNATISLIDGTETSELRAITGAVIRDGVIGIQFFCTEGRFAELLEYYVQCKLMAKDFGVFLKIDAEGHPSFEKYIESEKSKE